MTDTTTKPAVHSTFRIERHYNAAPDCVFQAFADPEAKRRWFIEGEGWNILEYTPAFEVGGHERSRFSYQGGPEMLNETIYQDIVPGERLVFCYRMALAGEPMSASLTTIELTPHGEGTLLVHTEQGTYLDGKDDGTMREQGTRELLDMLAREVEG
jgi:uncharacterized protein YndB with AHSA1/START domain